MPRKVSLKKIIEAIDKALAELEEPKGAVKSTAKKPRTVADSPERERAKKMLKGVRESVEGICFPNFDVPEP